MVLVQAVFPSSLLSLLGVIFGVMVSIMYLQASHGAGFYVIVIRQAYLEDAQECWS